jgi:hypothetical protein
MGMLKWLCEQDQEDFEQEQKIKEWIAKVDKEATVKFDYKHINSKGNIRNTLVRASSSLDQEIQTDAKGTFADLVAGCDGRDLYCGREPSVSEILDAYLYFLGLSEEDSEWVIKTLKLWANQNN